ncbi:MAG: aspartate--tRNA ligase [Candidatus Nanoarchaeia archaeon]|nr:aspartate--tRNA ligase [Candidatus Nanoarchaeia archaeon]
MLRTHTCGELDKSFKDKNVILTGWVNIVRSKGKIAFIDLRDRYGITQIFVKDNLMSIINQLKREYVIQVKGKVNVRPTPNKELTTGEIEVHADEIKILSEADSLPLEFENVTSNDDTRLKYRYLDLRNSKMQKNIEQRHKIIKTMRDFLDKQGFLEIETPILAKSTPEGARDYLVPSRINPGSFYALPQSPQLFKQLCMVSGFDKYFQVARCFRDEDLRADRQPEFTQLDIEMSFVEEKDIYDLMEKMIVNLFKEVLNVKIIIPFPRITYEEAMKKYNSDKPDTRKDGERFSFLWVTDFPMFEYSEEEKRWVSKHHPFTHPVEKYIDLLKSHPAKVKSRAYDLVLNGSEIGGGSIRIHDQEVQSKVFDALGISKKEAEEKFGFFLEALRYGTPPHGGIAFGIDRLTAIMVGEESIREVIAFPKNKNAEDLMTGAPSAVNKSQLTELSLSVKK